MTDVDLLFLSRDLSPPRNDVRQGIDAQAGVRIHLHRVVGTPRPADPNRWETIARARNEGKRLGSSSWVMCLDDDVVLGPDCIARLVDALRNRPGFAALAADSAGEMAGGFQDWDYPRHVGMAAVLFRRDRLAALRFRWEPDRCECLCCGDDLRRDGHGIGYLASARAWHRPLPNRARTGRIDPARAHAHASPTPAAARTPRILAAFNRGHYERFRRQFLPSLRASGNDEPVTAVAYDLHPSERARLEAAGVEVFPCLDPGIGPALQRVRDFPRAIERWPDDTPIAYWDAADVLFQGRLTPLWDLVRAHPDRLLAAREPVDVGESPVLDHWTATIRDPAERRRTSEIFHAFPFVNAGFAAGTTRALRDYLREANRLLDSALIGVGPWGDQVAMNRYIHENPGVWREIPDAWNYCLACRDPRTFVARPDGRVDSRDGRPVHVVHGNGRTLTRSILSEVG